MSPLALTLLIVGGAILLVVLWVIAVFNSLITLRNRVDEAWSDIDVQLKRRYDLIPNLLETVKGYAKHESETFEKVVKARSAAMNTENVHDKAAAENMLSQTLKSIFALAEIEAHPLERTISWCASCIPPSEMIPFPNMHPKWL